MVMDVKAVSALKADMPATLKLLQQSRNPILVVSNGQPQAVMQDVATYQKTQDAIALLKMMLQAENSVAVGRSSSTKDVLNRLRARVQAHA